MQIKIQHLSHRYHQENVLDNISLTDEIQTLSIIGKSGGGKSTLLKIMAGLFSPSEGKIIINNKEIPHTDAELIQYRRKMGYVFQGNNLFKHLTVIQNITFPLVKVHHQDKKSAEKKAQELLERFDLSHILHSFPNHISGGQQQRVAIVRALAHNPEVVFLDEPTSALDPDSTLEVLNMLKELKEQKINYIIATHEMGFAKKACQKTAFLAQGKISAYDTSQKIFNTPQNQQLKKFLQSTF